jgi:dipeptidyl aminopeptidase/acylaminoacyl peptidase
MRARRVHRITFALALLAVAALPAAGQGTRADYERAERLRTLTENKVFRDKVRPQWSAGGGQFWYRVRTGADQHEYVLVDAERGTRQIAFDHTRLAAALTAAGITDVQAQRLSLEDLDFDLAQQRLDFRSGGKRWRCDLASYTLTEPTEPEQPRAAPANGDRPRASTRTGPETRLTFHNQTQAEVELFWLDPSGRRRSYGRLRAGEQRDQHTYAGHVWLIVNERGEELAVFEAEEQPGRATIQTPTGEHADQPRPPPRRHPGNSPDGLWQAFVRDRNVHVKDLERDEEFALTRDGSADDPYTDRLHWSPDSARLVVLRVRPGNTRQVTYVEAAPKDQLQPKLHHYDYLKPGDRIPHERPQLFDVAARQQLPIDDTLFPNPWNIEQIRWSPDSRRFTLIYNQRGHEVLRVIAVDAASGQARAIVDEQSRTFIDYAHKQFVHFLDDTRELIWMSECDGWNHLYLYDSESGQVKNQITRGPWVVRDVDRVDEQARQIWFRAGGIRPEQDPYFVHLCRINFDGSGLLILTAGDGTHTVAFSPDRRFFVDTWSRVDLPPVSELRRAADGGLVCELERADAAALLQTGWRAPERFVAKGRDGTTDIYGVIFRPTNFDPQKKYPVIEDIYAGPQSSFVPKDFRAYYKAQALAELGFVVVKIDGMGTSNRSKAFHDVCWKNLADAGFPDRILWIKAAAQQYPYLDLTRVGIYGGSAGGQNSTGALLTHGDFYKVAVSDCGCHDNRMDKIWWNELWMGWPVGPHYAEQSNVTLAHRLQGRLLLIVGEMDENVDPASTLQVVSALIKANKDFDLLVIPGTGHGAAETPYGNRRRQDFFVRHLLGVEPRVQ